MTDQLTEAVIAGSKGFALALLAPLAERLGTRPRVAADLGQALALTGGSGLVVVEFQGDRSLQAVRGLVGGAAGIAVIAAVPDAHRGAAEALRALGVEPVRWDGRPDGVLAAVARRLAAAPDPAAAPSGPARPAPGPTAAAPSPLPGAATAPADGAGGSGLHALFDDIPLDEAEAEVAAAPAPPLAAAPPPDAGAWPAGVPGAAEAAAGLTQGLRGVFAPEGTPLAVVAGTMSQMSPLERAVLLGEQLPVDAGPIRRAAVMRVRVAAALASAPPAPGVATVDAGAVSALLAELDGLLSEVNALVAAAPAGLLQEALAEVRNALVKGAIDFSEAAHRALPAADAATPAPAATPPSGRAATARVVSVATRAEHEAEVAQARRGRRMIGLLVASALLAAAFHGYRLYASSAAGVERPTRMGAPEGATVVASPAGQGPVTIHAADGRPFSAEELKRMKDAEALKGNTVTEAAPGVVLITDAPPGAPPPGSDAPPPGR